MGYFDSICSYPKQIIAQSNFLSDYLFYSLSGILCSLHSQIHFKRGFRETDADEFSHLFTLKVHLKAFLMQDTIFEATPMKHPTSDFALSFSSPSLTYNPSLSLLLFILIHWTLTKWQIFGLFLFSVSQDVLFPSDAS